MKKQIISSMITGISIIMGMELMIKLEELFSSKDKNAQKDAYPTDVYPTDATYRSIITKNMDGSYSIVRERIKTENLSLTAI